MTHPLDRIKDADQALRWYLHLRDGGGQLKGLDIFASRDRCERQIVVGNDPKTKKPVFRKCGGPRTWTGRRGREIEKCASCAQSWKGSTEGWVREFVQGSRDPDAQVRTLDLYSRIRPIVDEVPHTMTAGEWLFDLQALALVIEGHGRNYTEAARLGFEHRPGLQIRGSRSWTPDGVQDAVARARRRIGERLAVAKRRKLIGGDEGVRIETSQIAQMLEISVATARRMCESGELKTADRKRSNRPGSPWTAEQSEVLKIKERRERTA